MKPHVSPEADALNRLGRCAKALTGQELNGRARARFERYLQLLLLWSRTQNLTALRSPQEMVQGLFEDSLLFLPLIPSGSESIVDIGAGAGVPGIPLAIVDESIRVVMIEARQKRVSFLRTVCRELEFGTRVIAELGRAEAVAAEVLARFGRFDVALARAVADAGTLRLIAMPLLREGGLLISTAPPVSAKTNGPDVRLVEVPHLGLKRAFFVTKRTA